MSQRSIVESLNDFRGEKGKIETMREVMIKPLMTKVVTGMVDLTTHLNSLNAVVEQVFHYSEHTATAGSYGELRQETGRIDICLQNSARQVTRQITLPKQTTVGEIMSAGVIPTLLVPKTTRLEGSKGETIKKKKNEGQKEVLDKIDLTGLEQWSGLKKKNAQELITKYVSIFTMSYMGLGKTFLS